MTPSEYASAAKQTESVVDSIQLNSSLFNTFASIFIASGEVLDMVKKNAFYGKSVDPAAVFDQIATIRDAVNKFPQIADKLAKNGVERDLAPQVDTRIVHSLLGVVTESAELLTVLKDYVNTGELDRVNLGEEFGDVDWYQAIGIDALGLTQEQVWDTNITKLHKKRYKNGTFTAAEAVNRDVASERAQLEVDLAIDHPETTPTAVSAESVGETTPAAVSDADTPLPPPTVAETGKKSRKGK